MAKKITKIIQKVQVWIVVKNEVLLLQVVDERGGGWHPITGHVEKGETLLQAAKRETKEETGIHSKDGQWINLKHEFKFNGRWGDAVEHVYAFELLEKPKKILIDSKEHLDFQWVLLTRVSKLLDYDSQKIALTILKEKLKCIRS